MRNNRMIQMLLLFVCLAALKVAAQPPRTSGIISLFEASGGYTIPDPNRLTSVVSLAKNESVMDFLGLSESQRSSLLDYFEKNGGTLSGVVNMPGSGEAKTQAMLDAQFAAVQAERIAAIEEILQPDQIARLKQVAYQTEVTRIGLGEALTSGRLGHDVGVHENQFTNIVDKAKKAEARAAAAIAKIRQQAQDEVLQELTAEQRTKAGELLGPAFYFRDDAFKGFFRPILKAAPSASAQ